ncbi:Uma2 family endonuclease [Streptomyces sp. NBS 14/10]|uniref:Uma2 family endonuclease n=1 Tax=Streptomyces sp. NBS 14/10 TaxID=1945643 RepID=UPI000B7E3AEE|nr:Uma2 family endonuclease [Streptomyces sp. NBS 14/10]KAK1186163.1 Uma2 family endonuclease [Streptomyces sp. NBS 14/10]NUP36383.1 Uma2 family endonuclease [Streptomyces sp.]NUS85147.1 Uma2 family endonuclease [Streptomyces sp.]
MAPELAPHTDTDGNTVSSVEDAFVALSAAAPEGWRVELIEGKIHVVPPANGEHEEIVTEVVDQVVSRRTDKELRTLTGIGLFVPGVSPTGKVIPDLVIAPKGSFSDRLEYHDPAPVLLVGEVTSGSTAENDRGPKLRGYAQAGIPCYLLIDRERGHVVVHTEPSGQRYARRTEVEIGKTVALPYPFEFELDTGEF